MAGLGWELATVSKTSEPALPHWTVGRKLGGALDGLLLLRFGSVADRSMCGVLRLRRGGADYSD